MLITPIAYIHTDFPTKFGIPRQSMLVEELEGKIIFEPEFRNVQALRGLEGFSHLWLLWQFSDAVRDSWSPTVRPPRLGGNKRMGVFATRSPFRPNPLGLSCVSLKSIDCTAEQGPIITVGGVDLLDNTPIYDIKPYLPYIDCIPNACGGFAQALTEQKLHVVFSAAAENILPENTKSALFSILEQDPRPHYQNDEARIYGFPFAGYEIRFQVKKNVLTVVDIIHCTSAL